MVTFVHPISLGPGAWGLGPGLGAWGLGLGPGAWGLAQKKKDEMEDSLYEILWVRQAIGFLTSSHTPLARMWSGGRI